MLKHTIFLKKYLKLMTIIILYISCNLMSVFNIKPDKVRHMTNVLTLDEMHRNKMKLFRDKKNYLPKLKIKYEKFNKRLEQLENKSPKKYTNDDIKLKAKLKTDIEKLKNEIYDIKNNLSEIDYLDKTADILNRYYEIIEENDDLLYLQNPDLSMEKVVEKPNKTMDTLDLINLMNVRKNKNKKTKAKITKRKKNKNKNNYGDIRSFFNDKINNDNNNTNNINNKITSRASCLDEYRMLTDSNYVPEHKRNINPIKECEKCNVEKTLKQSEGCYVCEKCGDLEMVIIESERPSYKDSNHDRPGYPYKRINHFNEWLSQFQAKESTEIPEEVYNKIILELQKNKFNDLRKLAVPYIKLAYMKKILKKINLQQYYEHITHIISKLSKMPPPTINRETEEVFRDMFRKIQIPFERNCPKSRINFLSYSYVLHKFCELLELDELCRCFPLLKSREKLREQDNIWKAICKDKDVRWQYIPSI